MSKKSTQTENQQLKRRAYQRLVGALVLLLVVIIVLPLVFQFDYQNRPNPLDVIFPDGSGSVVSTSKPSDKSSQSVVTPVEEGATTVTPKKIDAPKNVSAGLSNHKSTASQPVAKTVAAPSKQSVPVIRDASNSLKGKYYVQIIVYSQEKDAVALYGKLQKKGITNLHIDIVKRSANKSHYRLRSGPFATQKEAENMRAIITKQPGLEGAVLRKY